MAQADEFVRRTRQQAQQQMAQQHQTYTGGAQPGVMGYAAGGAALAAGGLMRGGQAAMAGGATAMGMGAAVAQPITNQVMMSGAGARGGMMPQGFFGLLTTAYAPQGMLPHAATSFHMERGLRREFAQEELGRRWDMYGRRAATTAGDLFTLGISSHIMRRTGVEARLFTEMSTERTLQQRMGVLRGQGQYGSATGFGVRRGFMTEGRGSEAMDELMGGAQSLQARFGYSGSQLDALTGAAVGAVDVTRVRRMAGRPGGMREMGREMRDIRETLARTARELQLTEEEMPKFINQLKSTMQVTASEFRSFREETRRVARAGPFTQRQTAEMGMQYMQFGRGQYFDPTRFRGEAFSRALEVAELRERGVISRDTLLREGGSLDQAGMQRMLMQRMQIQASAVQGGQFNQELILAGGNRGGYNAMMQGAGFLQTQGAVAGTLMRDPFALLRARLDPRARERVTQDAQILAYRKVQQLMPMLPGGEAQGIAMFGQRFGMNPEQAQPWYEEQQLQLSSAERRIEQMGIGAGDPARRRSLASFAVGFKRRTGTRMTDITAAMRGLGAGLGDNPAEMEANIMGFRDKAATRQTEILVSRFLQPINALRGVFSDVEENMEEGGVRRGQLRKIGRRGSVPRVLGQRIMEREETAGLERVFSAVGQDRMGGVIREMRGLGRSDEEISSALLGTAAQPQYERTHSQWRTPIQGMVSSIRGGWLAEKTWVELQGDKLQLMRQKWKPATSAEREIMRDLPPGQLPPSELLEGEEGWGEATPFEDPYGLAKRLHTAQRQPLSASRLIGRREFARVSGGPTIGMLRGIMGAKLLPEKLKSDKITALLDMDKLGQTFNRVEQQTSLDPVAGVARAFTAAGRLEIGGFEELRGAIKEKDIQALVKRFGGAGIKAGPITADAGAFGEFISSLGPERKKFAEQMMVMAMGQSDRLVKASKLGSGAGNAMWVQWEKKNGDETDIDVGSGK